FNKLRVFVYLYMRFSFGHTISSGSEPFCGKIKEVMMTRARELVYIGDKDIGAAATRLVVLIPGMSSSQRDWDSFIKRLQQEDGYGPAEAQWMSFEHGIRPWTLGAKRPEYVDTIDQPSNLENLA